MKTARFSEVVAKSGRPEIHLTWTTPSADPVLKTALKQSRLLTVHQQVRGAKKDFGVVGLEVAHDAQFLIFPKSLRTFVGRRVVGIQYDLLADTLSTGSKPAAVKRPANTRTPPPALPVEPSEIPPAAAKKKKAALPKPVPKKQEAPAPLAFEQNGDDHDDPVKAEIRRALTDLSVGDLVKVKRRLISLLRE